MLYDWLKAFLNLGRIARQHLRKQRAIMSALTDLQAAVASLDAKIVAHSANEGARDQELVQLRADVAAIDGALVQVTAQVVAAEAKLS